MDTLYFIFWLGIMSVILKRVLDRAGKNEVSEFIEFVAFLIALARVYPMIKDLINGAMMNF